MENRAMPRAGEFYMHFKGKLYQIVTVAIHTETEEPLVVYQAMYGTFKTYARPLAMFLSEVDHEKYPDVQQIYRFRKVELCENSEAELVDEVTAQENECDEIEETADIEPLLKFLDETEYFITVQRSDHRNDAGIHGYGNGLCPEWKNSGRKVL